MSSFIDAHCHLADPRFGEEAARIIRESEARGIGHFVQGGVDPADWDRQLALQAKYPGKIATAFGLHPWWVAGKSRDEVLGAFELLKKRIGEADALGETGLDHAPKVAESSRPLQREAFRLQLGLAQTAQKPLVLHIVRAHEEALEALQASGIQGLPGLVHSFSASREIAKKYLDLGLTLSISGVVCRKGFETLKRAVSYIPLDRLVLETDSPDQSPGEGLNEPVNLLRVADAVAALRGEKAEEILRQSAENLKGMFRGVFS
jgi:TatD DNase family protein